ncbi:MAG: MerR family transcriptional regulator [Bacteroidetes bacterium]|nr:MerR family transcriptional regulator [Bacteroidota bacterium]
MTKKKNERLADSIAISPDFKRHFQDYFSNPEPAAKDISFILNDRTKAIKTSVASYRQINSWDQYGLLDVIEREGSEWRKYSIMDALWLNIIYELRLLGYTIDQIKLVKESLAEGSKKVKYPMPLLEYCTFIALSSKLPVILMVFSDGSAMPIPYEEYKMNLINYGLKNHIHIDMNEILQRFFPDKNISPVYPLEIYLTYEEAELLSFIRMGEYERVEVRFKNKKMEIIEAVERLDVSKRMVDILKEQKYQSIEVIKKDDVIVSIVRKVKKKIQQP